MKHKILLISVLIFLIFAAIGVLKGQIFSAKAQNCYTMPQDELIRVGISTNDFSKLEYEEVKVSSENSFQLIDKSTGLVIADSSGKDIFHISLNKGKFIIRNQLSIIMTDIEGPIGVKSKDNTPIQIVDLKRVGKQAVYRGEIEVIKAPTRMDKLSVVNILPLEEYLKGVVPNESPVSFGLEALKAQSIAARNYAIRPRVKFYPQFDLCDSVQCQVYFGANTEHPLSNLAVDQTKSLAALYNGDIILALYSSTAGGYTESFENVFSDPGSDTFPPKPVPYLKGKPDIFNYPLLDNEDAAKEFYFSSPQTFDNASGYFRWTRSWSRDELENILNKNLSKYGNSSFISPKFKKEDSIGTLKDIKVVSRGVSGKAISVNIVGTNGSWTVTKELMIRRIFENGGKMLPSANIIVNNQFDENGNISKVDFVGGGLGHGVGMSQYGSGFMSKNGFTFDQILQHYYDGISIGTVPIVLNEYISFKKQYFNAPKGVANIMLQSNQYPINIKVLINSKELNLAYKNPDGQPLRINISEYVKLYENEIVFLLPDSLKNGANIKAWVEVIPSLK